MIQLYKNGNTDYDMNGDYTLQPVGATLRMVLNGEWVMELEIIQDEAGEWKKLQHDSVIKVDLPRWKSQLYVVSNPERTDFDTVRADCYPIGMWDARNELICMDCRPTSMVGRDALPYILSGCNAPEKYHVDCNINKISTAYYIRKNFIECLNSSDDNSFLNRWGGEIIYDNYTFRVYEQAGKNQGFVISAGRNVKGFKVSEDDSDFVDVIIPVAYNGRPCTKQVQRDQIGRIPHKRFVQYDNIKLQEDANENEEDDVIVCATQEQLDQELVKAAQQSFAGGEFLPSFTYDIDYADLRGYDEFKGYEDMLDLWLGDRVKVQNLDRHIQTEQKVIGLVYDVIRDEITSITLGSIARDFFNAASQATSDLKKIIDKKDGATSIVAERVKGVIDLMTTSMRAQKNAAVRQDARSILFEDLDTSSPLFGALAIGTQGLQIAKKRTADGKDWIWGTAINFESIIADYIITGILSGKDGKFWLNLDDGSYLLGDNGRFEGTITTTKDAKVGRKLFLDFDGNNEAMESGVYLGEEDGSSNRPRLVLQQYNNGKFKRIMLYTDDGDLKNGVFAIDYGDGGGSARIRSGNASVSAAGDTAGNSTIEIVGKKITVNDRNGHSGTGVTYSGAVSHISTINGIVVGAG